MRHAVLIVDDDPQVRTLCRIVLEDPGYIVVEASSGQQALAVIKKTPIDLILLDLSMPDMDGFEFLKAVRAESPTFKIIAMSGFLNKTMLPAARLLGSAATIAKPFSPDSLRSVVCKLLVEDQADPGMR
jgi:CheY-like chemotaxis protein